MRSFLRSALFIVLIPVSVLGIWIVALNLGANSLLRRRRPDPSDPPSNYGIDFEEVHFPSRDGLNLVGWWIPHDNALGTIIMCHGQNGSMDGDTRQMPPLHEAGFNVLMFDFRAHGRSEGESVTMGMYEKEDLLGAIDFLGTQYGVTEIGLLGFSMGAATALIATALSDRVCAVVADSSFGRLKRTLAAHSVQRGIPAFIVRPVIDWVVNLASIRTEGRLDQIDPVRWTVHTRKRPILFIQGRRDHLVSRRDLKKMANRAPGFTEIWLVEGAGHREAYDVNPDEYNRRVVMWFKTYLVNSERIVA